ncbi:hypothetical protein GBBBJNDB_00352 [Pseudomonas phage Callisto]|nr:hypothetical protein GBBBJNDB_00352 [Pseudomonas phage Callisto]
MDMSIVNKRFEKELALFNVEVLSKRTVNHITKPNIEVSFKLKGHTTEEEMTTVTQLARPIMEYVSGRRVVWAHTGLWRSMKDDLEVAVLTMKLSKQ